MAQAVIYSLISVVAVSLFSLVGLFTISLRERQLKRAIFLMVALAIGALLGDAFIHLIPEALEANPNTSTVAILVIAGILAFFILEKVIGRHHEHGGAEVAKDTPGEGVQPVGRLILVADGVHNFMDGIIIGASYLVAIPLGVATTIAVVLHEIPQEVGDFGVLLHAGYSRAKALLYNFFSALSAILGAIFVLIIGERAEGFLTWVLPVAAGIFIYLATVDLVPELHQRKGKSGFLFEVLAIALGVAAMYLLLFIEVG